MKESLKFKPKVKRGKKATRGWKKANRNPRLGEYEKLLTKN